MQQKIYNEKFCVCRIDICSDDKNCGILGGSRMGGMCDPANSVAVCEDNGLRLGFVIAHEIAHTWVFAHLQFDIFPFHQTKMPHINRKIPHGHSMRIPLNGKQTVFALWLHVALNCPPYATYYVFWIILTHGWCQSLRPTVTPPQLLEVLNLF